MNDRQTENPYLPYKNVDDFEQALAKGAIFAWAVASRLRWFRIYEGRRLAGF